MTAVLSRFALTQWCDMYFKDRNAPSFSIEPSNEPEKLGTPRKKRTLWPKLDKTNIRKREMLILLAVADQGDVLDGLIERIKQARSGGDGDLGPYELQPIHLAAFRGETRWLAECLAEGVDVNEDIPAVGQLPIHWAAAGVSSLPCLFSLLVFWRPCRCVCLQQTL